jgi:hypothetical protein
MLDKLFFDILFSKTISRLKKNTTHTIILFPVFKDIGKSGMISRLQDNISDIYKPIIESITDNEKFVVDPKTHNVFFFVPAFSDAEETMQEYSEDLSSYFSQAFDYILGQKEVRINGYRQTNPNKLQNICYTVDKENKFFTSYYKKKLTKEQQTFLDSNIVKLIEKLGIRMTNPKDPILSLTREETNRKLKAEGYKPEPAKLSNFLNLIETFVDCYKKTNNREYLKLSSSSDSQSSFKIYYRVNNTDNVDSFDTIKTGSNYVYTLTERKKTDLNIRIGYFIKKEGFTNQYRFREYTGLTQQNKKKLEAGLNQQLEEAQEKDTKGDDIPKEYVVQTRTIGSTLYYRRMNQKSFGKFNGTIDFLKTLHIYEKYKWFKFNDIDGQLSKETKIKFYRNILFDKASVIDFLQETQKYDEKTSVGVEFLRINQDTKRLVQYVDYLMNHKESSHLFQEDTTSENTTDGPLEAFVEKTKRAIADMIFEGNRLIYTTDNHSVKTKEDLRDNYKMITYEYYPVKTKEDLDKHFKKMIEDEEEIKYCKKSKCEEIESEISNNDVDYAIVIVDITKETILDVGELKKKTKCKKLRKTIRKQLQSYLKKLPQLGGKLRSRRRKYRR